ncbi:MAG: NADH ubiquinone oxidoreductase 20 kDa subunit [Candidatus Berkelbacteria bacterium Licking1014_7]|uniref:NADH ubiquinone oxidoreductase 20 kDa subunit n=1 Tax=Candidatus Berkelbacteria bacterium Licking1014_7 TaxID=2017147 RepID=A0A554LK01_9BACT|nr:MAG: NADH ubiquinone oxidoreductase 20 kDa subunit [Candidatus Berkelbacteria bacterium Licking1014_7]
MFASLYLGYCILLHAQIPHPKTLSNLNSNLIMKPTIAIYDFTDCEGCEVQLISLLEDFLEIEKRVEIVNWRLGQEDNHQIQFDICIIEGTPITREEQKLLRSLRKRSKILVALGACAALGGVPASVDQTQRKKWLKKIYGAKYKSRGDSAKPLSNFVKVDAIIPGCPATKKDILRAITDLLDGKIPATQNFPVCKECKANNNPCRLLNNQPCLGPVSIGGCDAICVSGGAGCWGCRGLLENGNLPAFRKTLEKFMTKQEIEQFMSVFLSNDLIINKPNTKT